MDIDNPLFAPVTPFDAADGIDEGALVAQLDFLYDKGVRAVIAGGTTGEFPSLTLEERCALFHMTRRHFKGAVLQNISATSTSDVQSLARQADGADALLILPPYYYASVSGDGLLAYMKKALHHIEKPVYLYHFPRHTQITYTPEWLARCCAALPVVQGMKDSGGAVDTAQAFQTAGGPQFRVFLGRDLLALAALRAGLAGSVSGAGVPFPECLVRLQAAFQAGDGDKADAIQASYDIWNQFRAGLNVSEIPLAKAALRLRLPGFPTACRPPLMALDEEIGRALAGFVPSFLEQIQKIV